MLFRSRAPAAGAAVAGPTGGRCYQRCDRTRGGAATADRGATAAGDADARPTVPAFTPAPPPMPPPPPTLPGCPPQRRRSAVGRWRGRGVAPPPPAPVAASVPPRPRGASRVAVGRRAAARRGCGLAAPRGPRRARVARRACRPRGVIFLFGVWPISLAFRSGYLPTWSRPFLISLRASARSGSTC